MKKTLQQIIRAVLSLGMGVALGALIINAMGIERIRELSAGQFILEYGLLILLLALAAFIQIAIHEAGHLVFGLLTGYKFVSYRLLSFMVVKTPEGLKLRRFSLAGTAGQCLMSPPDMKDGKMPYVIYNLGGVFMNLISAGLFLLLWVLVRSVPVLGPFVMCLGAVGIFYAGLNGIPMEGGQVPNDGWNALHIGRDPDSLRAFWVQLKVNELQSRDVRLRDMPEEWFAGPVRLDNAIQATVAVFRENRLMDMGDLQGALEAIPPILSEESAAAGIYKKLLLCDRLTCQLLLGQDGDYEFLYKPENKAFYKAMKDFPSVIRMNYVSALLLEKDEKAAQEALDRFEKIAKNYPAQADIDSERELFSAVRAKYQEGSR
ncbi:MAG: hypothetical protein II794_04680 [Oscillospiraceae bacterium]|nr:hypothetical protein [Oscillospiraceae bacterium]